MPNYYAHDHSQSAPSNPDVVPLSSLYTRVDGAGGTSHLHEGVKQVAGAPMMRPYEAPKRRQDDNPERALCAHEGCRAWPMKELEYCSGHARSLGLIENWSTKPKEPAEHDA